MLRRKFLFKDHFTDRQMFRNRDYSSNFTFKNREFEQMELEFFCKPGTDLEWFAYWKECCVNFLKSLNMDMENIAGLS